MSLPKDTRDKIPEAEEQHKPTTTESQSITHFPSSAASSYPKISEESDELSTNQNTLPPPYSPSAEADISLSIPTKVTGTSSGDTKIYIGDYSLPSSDLTPQNYATSTTITTQPSPIQYPSISSADLRNHQHGVSSRNLLCSESVPLRFCKICQEPEQPELLESSQDNTDNSLQLSYAKDRLISPCKCKGSLQYVHLSCLNEWRSTTLRQDASYRCEVCKYEYKFYRPKLAKVLESAIFLHTTTFIIFLLVIYGISWIIRVIDRNLINKHSPPPDSTAPGGWIYTNILGVEALHLIIGAVMISFVGVCFLMINSCINGYKSTRDDYCRCGGYECMECGGCYWFGGCGGGYGAGECGGFVVVLFIIIITMVFAVGIFGALSAGYLLIQKVSSIYLDRIKEVILEVKKDQ
ncbi:12788_t:CDS:1 [Acaulospora colombiana]|uniref:12788_t:CDS:1 n=1 Tax=Acaulospora colombiana TaxID=27376 RepID=A0ACA9N1S0_9GLOM|nr:12788_t:CDS:1 [Acaulospora colombiana]